MSKYDALWAWIRENGTDSFNLTFAEIEQIAGVSIDHSFLASKKELMGFRKSLDCEHSIIMEEPGMNGIILYQSKYGATKKYAQWLSERTGFPCAETKQARLSNIRKYDTILLGGGIYASGIAGLSFLKKNIKDLQGKRIIVFCVGASPYEEKAYREIVARNMKDSLSDIPCFYCRGAWDMEAMSIVDRNLCSLLRKAVAKKDPKDYEVWEQALMTAGDDKCDWTDQKYLEPILAALTE